MIEILNTFFIIIFFSILLSNIYIINFIKNKINLIDLTMPNIFSINLLIIMMFFLIVSFFEINLVSVTILFFLISLIGIIPQKNNKFVFKKDNIFYSIFFLILCLILSIDLVANPKLEWDGHGWYFHAFNFKENNTFFNLVHTDRYNHPHLGGIFWSILWKISFFDYEFYGRIFYVIIYLCAILNVSANVSKLFFNRTVISIILIFLTYDKFLFGGYQEILIFSIIVIIMNLIHNLNLRKLSVFQIFFISILSSLLLWSKNDGIIFFSIIIFYLIYYQNFKNKLFLISLYSISIILKFYFLNLNEFSEIILPGTNLFMFDFELFFQKIIFIILHTSIAIFKYPIWILFIFIIILKWKFKKDLNVIFFSLISISFIFLVYLFNDVEDYKWLITGSLDRLIFQSSGFLLLFVSNSIESLLRKSKY